MKIKSLLSVTTNINIVSSLLVLIIIFSNLIGNSIGHSNYLNQNCNIKSNYSSNVNFKKIYLSEEISVFPEFENLFCIGLFNNVDTRKSILINEAGNIENSSEIEIRVINSNIFLTLLRINLILFLLARVLLISKTKSKYLKAFLNVCFIEAIFEILNFYGLISKSTWVLTLNFLFIYFLLKKNILNFDKNENTNFKRISFREDINVLRGIAVLLVLFYHLDLQYFFNGFLGVDIFFVISGFLISSLILNSISNNKFLISDFYARRLKRLLPSLISVSLLIVLLFYNSVYPFIYKSYLRGLFWNSIYLINIHLNNYLNYFTENAFYIPYLHLWSISVEEQFYILYPIVFFLFVKKKFNYEYTLLFVYVLSISYFFITENYYLIFSRFWQFILGYYAYLIFNKKMFTIKNKPALTGIWFVTTALLIFFNRTLFDLVELTFIVSFFSLFFLVLDNNSSLLYSKHLKSIGFIGTISYSIYLFHQPIIVWLNLKHYENLNLLFTLLIVFLVSYINYRYIEKFFRQIESSSKNIFKISILNISLIISIIFLIPNSVLYSEIESQQYEINKTHYINIKSVFDNIENIKSSELCHFNFVEFDSNFYSDFKECRIKNSQAIFILGDSHADSVYNMLIYRYDFVIRVGNYGCRIQDSTSNRCNFEKFKNFYNLEKSDGDIVLYNQSGFYFYNDSNDNPRLNKIKLDTNKIYVDRVESIKNYLKTFEKGSVAVIGPWIEPGINPLNYSYESLNKNLLYTDPSLVNIFTIIDTHLREELAQEEIQYISTLDFYLENKENYIYDFNKYTFNFKDTDHLSQFGEKNFSFILIENLENMFLQLQKNY